ncbi:unnamed protein product [Ectocarpus sp. 12 AP-2014]
MYDGGSEAGSRYTPSRPAASESAVRELASFCMFGSQHSTAEARIQELRDRQRVKATPVTFQASMSMPSPGGPVTPGTDWDLAQGIAPSPGPNGRRRALMVGRQNRSRSRSKGRHGGGSSRTSMDGGEGTSGDRSSSRPPSSRGSSVSRGAAGVGSSISSGAGGGGDGGDNSSSPTRSRGFRRRGTPGQAGTRGSSTTPGRGGGGGEDSDSNSVSVEDSRMAGAGGQEERRRRRGRRRQGVVNHPAEPCDDSEGESRFNDGAITAAASGDDISLLRSSLTLV